MFICEEKEGQMKDLMSIFDTIPSKTTLKESYNRKVYNTFQYSRNGIYNT